MTREAFMVSIFDYDKDAEEAKEALKAAAIAAGGVADRNLSVSVRRSCRRGAAMADSGAECRDWRGGAGSWQIAAPGWGLAGLLLAALAWVQREKLRGLLLRQPHSRRRLVFSD